MVRPWQADAEVPHDAGQGPCHIYLQLTTPGAYPGTLGQTKPVTTARHAKTGRSRTTGITPPGGGGRQ